MTERGREARLATTTDDFDCQDVTEIPCDECEALVALYNSTDGPNWTNNTNWLQTTTPSNWYGVQVVGGHVTLLWLHARGIRGSILPRLGDLEHIQDISMAYNQLSGSIPP